MALLDNELINQQILAGNQPVRNKIIAAKINDIHTDIVLLEFSDRVVIVLTQYKKLGCLIEARKDTTQSFNGSQEVYSVKVLFGAENISYIAAARFLYEQLQLSKPCMFFISLKAQDLPTLKALRQIIIQNKIW